MDVPYNCFKGVDIFFFLTIYKISNIKLFKILYFSCKNQKTLFIVTCTWQDIGFYLDQTLKLLSLTLFQVGEFTKFLASSNTIDFDKKVETSW